MTTMEISEHAAAIKPVEPYELVDLAAIIRGCRLNICEAFYFGGADDALAEIERSSITLTAWVLDGSLMVTAAHDPLQEVAENLRLVEVFGQDRVQAAIVRGHEFYRENRAVAA